jgi:hypothetical protein
MSQIIEIEGALVNVIDRTVRYSVPLDQWLPQIERRSPVFTPVVPSGTRAIWWDPTDVNSQKLLILVEREPQTISLNLQDTIHRLSIPWSRFFFYAYTNDPQDHTRWRLEDYRLMWAQNSYTNPNTKDMLPASVPNVYSDGRICFGATGADANQNLSDRIDQTINEFYATQFNLDLGIRYPNRWRGYASWVAATARDPMCWTNWNEWTSIEDNPNAYSFNMLANEFVSKLLIRTVSVIAPDPIPPLALGATFGHTREWLESLTNNQRARLLEAALQHRSQNNTAYEPNSSEED